MNLFGIFSEIEKVDPEASEKLQHSRRKMLKTTAVAAVATPAFLAASMNKAFASAADVNAVLNYALTLEYLERNFYRMGLFATNLVPQAGKTYVNTIARHEAEHVDLLKGALGSMAIAEPMFDFTAGGMFPTVFSSYETFLTLAQAFEDTGVRAYKGGAGILQENSTVLGIALQIHSVEARHAAAVRTMRGQRAWPVMNNNGFPGAIDSLIYKDEDPTSQAGVDLVSKTAGMLKSSKSADILVKEAFDEPLDKDYVTNNIASLFIKKSM